ncbi:putative protein time for coffee [Helianthus annuus]|uniref:protein TIME FOR COFFEE isoform X4 n=1 Tax=Helianthus annuus TaxID=4232 RepID=UPI0016533AA6|nr:protein TIME FOR COFFEE isoform X4 [Helianthus annuus]KAJ0581099.1 putative protein time for coffee [Helianthus annuus]KAJ0597046.1 putative protein time for coffee [Helianthus annuus]KAJ0757728.1 putative protein time for coffee [Helianthus annuus]
MDRNREGRRATNLAALPNGLSSSRRRHRSSSLRDSPDEEGGAEVHESGRLRDRGVVKKDRGERDRERERERDRDRERERSSRSKRRRENRMIHHHTTTGSNRDDGDDTTSESVNEEEEDDDDGGGLRMLHQPPVNQSTAAVSTSNHHNHNSSSSHPQQIHHRKSFPSGNKVFRAAPAAAPPAWKAADEMIGVSVPRKARSASTKRNHEWISGVVGVGGTGNDQIHRQSSDSPVRLASPAPAAPPSPSSSNVSVRKKMKASGGGSKPRPPKSSSKSSSSNPEELEIEIAEVLYGLMTQSQAPKKEIPSNDSNKLSSDTKSRVSSPISNSAALPQNSTSLSTVAPKRKRPRQVLENPVSSSIKTEIDHHQQQRHQSPKTDISSPYLENSSPASAAVGENGLSSFGFTTLPSQKAANSSQSSEPPVPVPQPPAEEERKCGAGAVLTKEEVEKESLLVKLNDGNSKVEAVITTAASSTVANLKLANPESQSKKDEKFEIDLMAPPPQQRTSHGSDGRDIDLSDHKEVAIQETSKIREDEKLRKSDINEQKVGVIQETGESSKQGINEEINIQLNIDLKKPNKGSASMVSGSSNPSLHQALKHPQLSAKSETHSEKTAQSSAMPMPMSVPNWPPVGYVAPLQGVISMDGNTMASAPFQPILTHPRPKRCATHCYIARNIHCNQQFMKMNPFWPAASGSATPMFGAKPCNLNVMPSTELHANIPQSIQDKGQAVGILPGYTTGKDTKSSQPATITDPAQRKQQVLLQQTMPSVAPNNILHGPAFIFPFNQQQAVAAASASVRPGPSKLTTSTAAGGLGAASGAANSATVTSSTTAVAPALSFNYPNINANETQYLAILQNNPYSFPMPAVGAPPNYRPSPHAQAMPLFNGSFYSSQMIHPSQVPQQPQQATPPTQAQNHHPSQSQQTHQNSSGSTSSSQKHLQAQQRPQGIVAPAASGSGNIGSLHNSYHAAAHKSRSQQSSQQQQQNPHMNPALQVRHLENEVTGGEDSPSTADSRVSRAANTMSVYSHNFSMSGRSKAFPQMDHPNGALTKAAGAASANSSDKKQQQQQSQQQGLKRGGVESSLPPQAFAMSFAAPMNGTTGNISSMAQNHAIFQSLPESLRQSYMMAAPTAAAHQSQQKDFRISEEAARTGHDSSNADEDRKVSSGLTAKSGQSIAFSRPDLVADASGSNNRSSRSPMSSSMGAAAQSSHPLSAHYQPQQHALQLQKQQQQNQNMNNARAKNQASSNGSAYPEHLITSSSSMTAKFPNSISSFPLQTSNTSSSPVQSPQWRNPARGPTTSQVPSSLASATTTSSLKNNLHQSQQQSSRSHPHPHQQSHTQISFGTTTSQKPLSTASVQMQNQNPSSNSGNQSPSPPMLVGSPTASISKGVGGGTSQGSSLSSSQPAKNSPVVVTQRSSPGILGNPNSSNSTKSQQQLQQKQTLHQQKVQAMMMYGQPYMQVQQQAQAQAQQHAASSMSQAQMMMYTHPIRLQQQQQQQQQQQSSSQQSSSTAMLSLCPPVTHASTTTSDPAKAIAAATSMMNHPQYGAAAAQSSMPAGFPQYVHNSPAAAAVQVKPAEQKQPAGNDNLRVSQPEKK